MARWAFGLMKQTALSYSIAYLTKTKPPKAVQTGVGLIWMAALPILLCNIICHMITGAAVIAFFNIGAQVRGMIIFSGITSAKTTARYPIRRRGCISGTVRMMKSSFM